MRAPFASDLSAAIAFAFGTAAAAPDNSGLDRRRPDFSGGLPR